MPKPCYQVGAMMLGLLLLGCSNKPGRIPQPDIDANEVALAAMEMLDEDGSGTLSAGELADMASLQRSLDRLDANGDQELSSTEIANRIEEWQEYGSGLVAATCTVFQKGKPLEGATVTYEPEDFFGGSIFTGYGKTNAGGRTIMSVAEEHRPKPVYRGLQTGFYKIVITYADGSKADDFHDGIEIAGDLINQHKVSIP